MGDLANAAADLEAQLDAIVRRIELTEVRLQNAVSNISVLQSEMFDVQARLTALETPPPPPAPDPPPIVIPPAPKLMFVEEWDNGLDPTRWEPSLWGLRTNRPNELQSYLPSQVLISGGYCTLRAERGKANPDGMPWVSGIVSTRKRLSWLGGRFEVRAKMPPQANGGWPGIWLFPASGNWYADGEIDFGEALSQTPDQYSVNVHWHDDPAGQRIHRQSQAWVKTTLAPFDGFHVYGCEWAPGERVTFTFDGELVYEVTAATAVIPSTPMYLIIDLSISSGDGKGGWGRPPDATTPPVVDMVIDWVRVWQ
jgi:beta-glucanase (GH16 family)